ncbi:MAG: HhH-GPD family protein [Candidatus Aquicultor sp.]
MAHLKAVSTEQYKALEEHVIERFNKEGATDAVFEFFREFIWAYYAECGRVLPWRETNDPYRILISEVMLQQTQVPRVLEKYRQFLALFPSFEALADAPLRDVLEVWQGLGYNRRAVALKNTAEKVVAGFDGKLPANIETLKTLPGIGPATASAIRAFAFNQPTVFIETNIRAVYIHFFFHDEVDVKDKELLPFIDATVDRENPREWYYALMDYGVLLKKTGGNPSRKSAHHKAQSPYEGSNRKLRADTLRVVLRRGVAGIEDVADDVGISIEHARTVLNELVREGFAKEAHGKYEV